MQRRAVAVVAALAVSILRCSGSSSPPPTAISRGALVHVGAPRFDDFFRAVHALQVTLNEAERIRMGALARLDNALALDDNRGLEATMAQIRERTEQVHRAHFEMVITLEAQAVDLGALGDDSEELSTGVGDAGAGAAPADDDAPDAPGDAAESVAATALDFTESQSAAEASVHVSIELRGGGVTLEVRQFVEAIRLVLLRLSALRRRLDALTLAVPAVRADGVALRGELTRALGPRAGATEPELRSALEFLDGAGSWARAEQQATEYLIALIRRSATVGNGS